MNSIQKLAEEGQSIWLDFIQRGLMTSGKLKQMIAGGLRGVTSNPAIFEKAVASGNEYDAFLSEQNAQQVQRPVDLYEALAIRDVQDAADVFTSTYEDTAGRDGYVSLEVSPHLAQDAEGTLAEARRLWARVNRSNVMIKVPATPECVPVIRQLIADGINVNVTLLFSEKMYADVAEAFVSGLEYRAKHKLTISNIASVASFFISRIDSAVDKVAPQELQGKAAIANAKLTYQYYKKFYASERFKTLEVLGAKPQRLLWASTGTKNPAYSDVLYVEELVGPETVNTIPPATYEAFLDHGKAKSTLELDLGAARQVMSDLKAAGVDFDAVTDKLLSDGIKLFVEPFDKMLAAIAAKYPQAEHPLPNLWEQKKNNEWLGWLDVILTGGEKSLPTSLLQREDSPSLVLLGMGGSSLAPDVMNRICGPFGGFHVLDSTDPEQIADIERQIDVKNTMFIVSSKSGSTLEPNIFFDYFVAKAKNPKQFIAITDPGSALERVAQEKGFLSIYPGVKSIGGRYSALSNFGLVPAALMGVDTAQQLEHALSMRQVCMKMDALDNPGARLGLFLGNWALKSRDKVTLITSKELEPLGDWVEQLLAESTGKQGKGLIPVVGESIGAPHLYASDRAFVYVQLGNDASMEHTVEAFERAGHPVFRINVASKHHLGAEFYRWEVATAVAGEVLGINAFDQPDVEAAKVEARRLMEQPSVPAIPKGSERDVRDLLSSVKPGDYFAIQAFVPMNAATRATLQKYRMKVRDLKKVATTLGFGPRFLHSTGQLHKGGPDSGVFLQVVSDATTDLAVPGKSYGFDQVKHAQALGDFNVLKARGRRVISISWETLCKLV
ncbi:MAG: transaldolase [Myxococcota bacterium]